MNLTIVSTRRFSVGVMMTSVAHHQLMALMRAVNCITWGAPWPFVLQRNANDAERQRDGGSALSAHQAVRASSRTGTMRPKMANSSSVICRASPRETAARVAIQRRAARLVGELGGREVFE